MLFQWVRAVLLLAAFSIVPSFAARADGARSALVIGNSNYVFAPLANPSHDANDIAQTLRKAGFSVDTVLDADKRKMQEAIAQFGTALGQHKGVGFFYYAGHGVQIAGENYLVPTDAAIDSEASIKESTVNASSAVDAMAATGVSLNIVVLDACRNNPLTPTGFRGLSRMDSSDRLFVSFSTRPGAVALDGDGRNSPYAKHLAQAGFGGWPPPRSIKHARNATHQGKSNLRILPLAVFGSSPRNSTDCGTIKSSSQALQCAITVMAVKPVSAVTTNALIV